MLDDRYLKLLATEFPNARKATSEIVNLNAILSLPKGTEYFLSDLHGEHEAFIHMVNSASGVIRAKIDETFGKTLSEAERHNLAALVYNAEAELARRKKTEDDFNEWCRISIYRLIEVCKSVSTKYTRSKVRKRIPDDSEYIMDELLNADDEANRAHYYSEIINSLLRSGVAETFIADMTQTISRLAVDRLHIIGDVFDRGAHPDIIMDYLIRFHDVDFQWGNHDVVWMGAAAGNLACIANVIRMNISYNNFDMLEIGYGLNLRSLSSFATDVYWDDPCDCFRPHILDKNEYDPVSPEMAAKMHKAITVIQFKLEGALIAAHPEYDMADRRLLEHVDYAAGTVRIGGTDYPLRDTLFPTIDPASPYTLTADETELMRVLAASFHKSEKLQRHIRFLFSHGAMYKVVNGNLLYHGCILMKKNGEFETFAGENGETLSGRAYMDRLEEQVRRAYFEGEGNGDVMWYLWCGGKSPLFGKNRMATFERTLVADKATHTEKSDPYYALIAERPICEKILREFGLPPESSHILNGHVPVKIKDGETPVKGDGLLFVIDGGISKAYHKRTGIAGYTFIYNSHYMALSEHKPYTPIREDGTQDFEAPTIRIVERLKKRVTVKDTDIGKEIEAKIEELEALVDAFGRGAVKEGKASPPGVTFA